MTSNVRTPGFKSKRNLHPDSAEKATTTKKPDIRDSSDSSDIENDNDLDTGNQRSQTLHGDIDWLNADRNTAPTTDSINTDPDIQSTHSIIHAVGNEPNTNQKETPKGDIITGLPTMLENFSELFCSALIDPRTVTNLTNIFQPLMLQQTNDIKDELKTIKGELQDQKTNITKLTNEMTEIKNTCEKQKEEITSLSNVVIQQQQYLEKLDTEKRRTNMIMTGIKDAKYAQENNLCMKTKDILETIGVNEEIRQSLKITRINGSNQETAVMKLCFNSTVDRDATRNKAKRLKETDLYKHIYLKADRTPLASKEDYRLRQKKRQLTMDNPDANITLRNGILSLNGRKVDEFNIVNQIFRPSQPY